MAQYLSAERAVMVKTETPIEMFLAVSDNLQTATPHGHDSKVYNTEVKGTQVTITSRSASAKDRMYLIKSHHRN